VVIISRTKVRHFISQLETLHIAITDDIRKEKGHGQTDCLGYGKRHEDHGHAVHPQGNTSHRWLPRTENCLGGRSGNPHNT